MARILPFKGIYYNPHKIDSYADVTTPPYDVISETQRDEFYTRHPNNIIRLILGKSTPSDTPSDNPHTRAAAFFREWLAKDILVRSKDPALYLTAVEFPYMDQTVRRYGLIAKVGLEPFERKIILPHEKTFSKVKSERLELMKVCHANFSPIFSLYTDTGNILHTLATAAADTEPEMNFFDDSRHRHYLWRFTNPDLHQYIMEVFKNKRLFIADGHHRYETALNYRNRLKETQNDWDETHPANFIMMALSSMNDPGLVILPAHRILSGVSDESRKSFIQKAQSYFDVTVLPAGERGFSEMLPSLNANGNAQQIGVVIRDFESASLLSPKPGIMNKLFGNEIPAALQDLDVTVLTRLILMELLGFDQQQLDNEKTIAYSSKETEAIQRVVSGQYDISFILRPTKIEQVRQVAEKGLIMPRKSTYFYPKALTGQVLNDLLP